jgi:hypothetical protein
MSSVSQDHLLEVLKNSCAEVASQSDLKGYEKELLKTLIEIVQLERNNVVRPGPIQKRIADKIDTLGQVILSLDLQQGRE